MRSAAMSALSIAASGMFAAEKRLKVSASNVANMFDTGALAGASGVGGSSTGTAYQPLRLQQTEAPGGGTSATVVSGPAPVASYAPEDPSANASGMVASPNVDLAQETVDQISARLEFSANVTVVAARASASKTAGFCMSGN